MSKKTGIGIIGCGNISTSYLDLAPLFKSLNLVAVADINMDAANARAADYPVRAETVEGLLAATDVDVIVNLTIPAVHYDITRQIRVPRRCVARARDDRARRSGHGRKS